MSSILNMKRISQFKYMYSVLDSITYLREDHLKPNSYTNRLDLHLSEDMNNVDIVGKIFAKFDHVIKNTAIDRSTLYDFFETIKISDQIIRLASYGGIIIEWNSTPWSFIDFHNGPKVYLQFNLSKLVYNSKHLDDISDKGSDVEKNYYMREVGFFAIGVLTGILISFLRKK